MHTYIQQSEISVYCDSLVKRFPLNTAALVEKEKEHLTLIRRQNSTMALNAKIVSKTRRVNQSN